VRSNRISNKYNKYDSASGLLISVIDNVIDSIGLLEILVKSIGKSIDNTFKKVSVAVLAILFLPVLFGRYFVSTIFSDNDK